MVSLKECYETARKANDGLGIGEVISIASGAKKMVPGAGYTPGMDKVMGPIGAITSGIDVASGSYHLVDGIRNGNAVESMGGVHDLIGGTAGLIGMAPGPVGAVAKSFSAGYAVGDALAPYVFGSEEEGNRTHYEDVPEDGDFKPTTGNSYVDGALDLFGIRD